MTSTMGNGLNKIIEARMDGCDPLTMTDADWLARPMIGARALERIKGAMPEYRRRETNHAESE